MSSIPDEDDSDLIVPTYATGNVVPLPAQDAKARAAAETKAKEALFKWADELLEQIGIAQKIAEAQSIDAVQRIQLDVDAVDVVLAIREALHPSSGDKPAPHFRQMKIDTLKRVLKMRFKEMVRYRELDLERRSPNERYNPNICLPDVIQAAITEYIELKEHEAVAAPLWALHTHAYEEFMVTPRLALQSPKPGCGKSTLLDVLSLLTPNAKRTSSTTAAERYFAV
jgi:hypothetical protein